MISRTLAVGIDYTQFGELTFDAGNLTTSQQLKVQCTSVARDGAMPDS